MKSLIIAAVAVSLLSLINAQPHGHRHVHPRADITDYVTVTAPEVVVWVDDQGNTVSIETRTDRITASTLSPMSPPSVVDTPAVLTPSTQSVTPVSPSQLPSSFFAAPAPAPTELPATSSSAPAAVETTPAPAPAPAAKEVPTSASDASNSGALHAGFNDSPSSASMSPPQSAASASPATAPSESQAVATQPQNSGGGFGITWSPYNADSSCKSQDQANSELGQMASAGFTMVRIYGVDCNQLAMTISAVSQSNMAIFAGVTGLDNLAGNLASMIAQVGSNWHMIDTVSICNECINNNLATVGDVVAALGTARSILPPAGFAGHIVTVDVFNQFSNHPELCENSDYCAANCHAFFDDQLTPDQAGAYVRQQAAAIAQALPGKAVVITESGWPWAGSPNGAAVPSVAQQQAAIASLRSMFASNPGGLILFDSFDAGWKQPGPYGVEQYFGIYGH